MAPDDEEKHDKDDSEKDNPCWDEIPADLSRDDDDTSQYEQWQT